MEEYQGALGWNPSSPDLHLEIAGLFREKGDLARAVSECRTAVQLSPDNERVRIALISALTDSGDFDSALAEAKEGVRIWPERPYFHYLFGRVLVKKNDPDDAIVELQWALKKEKNRFSPANCELGRAFELKGDPKAAQRQYHTAIRAHGAPPSHRRRRAGQAPRTDRGAWRRLTPQSPHRALRWGWPKASSVDPHRQDHFRSIFSD